MIKYVIIMCKDGICATCTTTDFWKANVILEQVSADPDVVAWIEEVED